MAEPPGLAPNPPAVWRTQVRSSSLRITQLAGGKVVAANPDLQVPGYNWRYSSTCALPWHATRESRGSIGVLNFNVGLGLVGCKSELRKGDHGLLTRCKAACPIVVLWCFSYHSILNLEAVNGRATHVFHGELQAEILAACGVDRNIMCDNPGV